MFANGHRNDDFYQPTYVPTYHYNEVVARSINYGNGVMTFLQTYYHAVARVE